MGDNLRREVFFWISKNFCFNTILSTQSVITVACWVIITSTLWPIAGRLPGRAFIWQPSFHITGTHGTHAINWTRSDTREPDADQSLMSRSVILGIFFNEFTTVHQNLCSLLMLNRF